MLARNVGRLGAPELRPVVNPFAKITKQSGYLKRCWYFFHVIPTLVFPSRSRRLICSAVWLPGDNGFTFRLSGDGHEQHRASANRF